MIKTVSINLGGIVFQIDEDAYETLRNYLDSVTQYYKYQEGREDIVADIESRFAEIFSESFEKTGFDVISLGDVEEVVEIMGRPEDFDGEGERVESEQRSSRQRTQGTGKVLYRDTDSAVLAGVCSGLAAYWGIKDPLWLRLAFIATALFSAGTVGVVIYIILWIVVPEAKTSAHKLEMRGEPVNLSNLEKKIRTEINEAGERITDFATSESNSGLRSVVNGIGKLFGAVAKLVWVILKIALAVFVIGMVIALAVSLIAALVSFLVAIPLSLKYIFSGVGAWLLAVFGGLLIIIVPLVFLVYLPFRLYGKRRMRNRRASGVGIGLLILGVIMAFAAASIVGSYFSEKETVASQEMIPFPPGDTLYLAINSNEEDYDRLDYNLKFSHLLGFNQRLETASDWVELDIVPSTDGNIYLERSYKARGRTVNYARQNAGAITYNAGMKEGQLTFDPVFGLGEKKKWRSQGVKLRLKVPEGMVVVPGHDMTSILDDAENSLKASKYTVAGNRWKMQNGTLEPIDSILTLESKWNKERMERMPFTDFDEIDIRGDVDVEIVQSDVFEVYMLNTYSSDRDLDIDKEGSTLTISREGWKWGETSIGFLGKDDPDPKFYIALPKLNSMSVHRQAYVVVRGFRSDVMSLDLGGQCSVLFEGLEVGELEADLHGQSTSEIIGQAKEFTLECSGQSNFDGAEFSVDKLQIDMSGQSDAEMIVNKQISGSLSGQSDLEYWGSPDVDVTSSGQSDIDRR